MNGNSLLLLLLQTLTVNGSVGELYNKAIVNINGSNPTQIRARTTLDCGSFCLNGDTCTGYKFDHVIKQCTVYRGCGTQANTINNDEVAYTKTFNDDLAHGKEMIASGEAIFYSSEYARATDGLWAESYSFLSSQDRNDVFCTNSGNGADRWVQVDLAAEFIICGVDIYNQVGGSTMRGDILVTVSSDLDLITDRDRSECGFQSGQMTESWNYIACSQAKRGRYVKIEQLWSSSSLSSLCFYEILVYGY